MMTNRKNTSLNTQNLKNKSFYIDTNILYRAIGLNGDGLKTRAHLFLSKFKEVGEKLVLSQSTYVEFTDSVDYYIGKIDKSQRPRVNSNVLKEFLDEDSVFLFYCKWRVGRVDRDASYFKDWIMSEFNSLCDRYGNSDEQKMLKVMACGFGIGISLGACSFEISTDDILPILEDDAIFEEGLITNPNQLYQKK